MIKLKPVNTGICFKNYFIKFCDFPLNCEISENLGSVILANAYPFCYVTNQRNDFHHFMLQLFKSNLGQQSYESEKLHPPAKEF